MLNPCASDNAAAVAAINNWTLLQESAHLCSLAFLIAHHQFKLCAQYLLGWHNVPVDWKSHHWTELWTATLGPIDNKASIKHYLSLCEQLHTQLIPTMEPLLCRFVMYLANLKISHNFIKIYKVEVRRMHATNRWYATPQSDPRRHQNMSMKVQCYLRSGKICVGAYRLFDPERYLYARDVQIDSLNNP